VSSTLTIPTLSDRWAGWSELMADAYRHATASPDPSTQNAAVLVNLDPARPGGAVPLAATWAVNEFPHGVAYTPARFERPLKYAVIEHAERGAVYNAARSGIATDGLAMLCPWAACADCARAIICAGVTTLVTHRQAHDRSPQNWLDSIAIAFEMLAEAGVTVTVLDLADLGAPEVRHTGQIWTP
jgi:dCMP deaminase